MLKAWALEKKRSIKQVMKHAAYTCVSEHYKMNDKDISFATGYLILERRIRRKKERDVKKDETYRFERFINKGMKLEFSTI